MTQYNDLFVRDNFQDTGVIPSSGELWQSPDIIPFQDKTLSWDQASSTYYSGSDIGKSIINKGINNIYVRARNLNNVAGSGKVGLYYTDYSLNLCQTSKWVQLKNASGTESLLPFVDGSGRTTISADGIAISNPSFLLTGLPPGPHYCMIAVVQTTAHPITIPPTFASNSEYCKWVEDNPGVSYRNLSYSPNTQVQMSRVMRFGNVNRKPMDFLFEVTGNKFITGTPITIQCTDKTYPIDNSGNLPDPDPQGNQTLFFKKYGIPANFWGDLVVTATSPKGNFPTDATLTVSYYQYADMSDAMDKAVARRYFANDKTGRDAALMNATLIKIGECTVCITDNPLQAE